MTEKLYEQDSHRAEFRARVTECRSVDEGFEIVLDQTAFFPESGGQYGDRGSLNGIPVLDTKIRNGIILHKTAEPIPAGTEVEGRLNWELRFRRMQNHSGEHIVSGLVHKKYGFDNVGFHLGDGDVTLDFNGELNREQLREIEAEANGAVWSDIPLHIWFPDSSALERLNYRSKLELTENVRIVEIPGYDICACCAPHVNRTGEIGMIKILDFMRHRGGVRVHILCGRDALEDYDSRYGNTLEISGMLSAKQRETAEAVRRKCEELAELRQKLNEANRLVVRFKTECLPETEGNLCFIEENLDMLTLRELVNAGMQKCTGICGGFTGREGEWQYIIGSRTVDLRKASKEINAAISGRGGGKPEMIQGSSAAKREQLLHYFETAEFGA